MEIDKSEVEGRGFYSMDVLGVFEVIGVGRIEFLVRGVWMGFFLIGFWKKKVYIGVKWVFFFLYRDIGEGGGRR